MVIYHAKLTAACNTNISGLLPSKIYPRLAGIHFTENCNSRCLTCDCWRSRTENEISTQRAIDLFGELNSLGIKNIRLAGGEPLMRQDLFEILEQLDDDPQRRITLATNGLMLRKYADKINDSPITNLTVSLDGIGETNDQIRGITGGFDRVWNSLSKINKKIKIASILTNKLAPDIKKMVELCESRGYGFDLNLLDDSIYLFASEEVQASVKKLWPNPNEATFCLDYLVQVGKMPKFIRKNAANYLKTKKFCFKHCIQGFVCLYIDAQGNVRTGCYAFNPVGNILKKNLKQIIHSEEYLESARKMYRYECSNCTCGYGISATYHSPISGVSYAMKRLKTKS